MLTLYKALKTGRLQEFMAREEARGVPPVNRSDLDSALDMIIKPSQSEVRTSRSPSGGGLIEK